MLAPDDPKWVHRDDELPAADAGVGAPRALRRPARPAARATSCTARTGLERLGVQARLFGRRLLVPDENVTWNLTAIPAAIRIVAARGDRRRADDLAAELGALRRRGGQARDRRALGRRPARLARRPPAPARATSRLVRLKEQGEHGVAALVARYADAIVAAAEAIAEEARALEPRGPVVTIANGSRLRRLRRARVPARRPLPDHARGQLLRQARPAAVPAPRSPTPGSTSSPASSATSARPTASGRRRSGSATGSS